MPSRKIVSVFIICSALVASIILGFGNKSTTSAITGGLLSKGPGGELSENIPENTNWRSDLSPLALNSSEVSALVASSTGNLTDQVAQSLMSNYLSLRESGNLNNDSAQVLIDQALEFTDSGSPTGARYTTKDIVVSPDNSQVAIRTYGTDLGNAFKINDSAKNKGELALFGQILQSQDKSRIPELKKIGTAYRNIIASIKNIKVPSKYTATHLQILNSLEKIAGSIDNMAIIFDDPIRSMAGIGKYQEGYSELSIVIKEIRIKILKEDKVIYKQGESGYYLYYGL